MTDRKHYSYVLDHDTGLAPNPFFGYLTLALCKPRATGQQGPRNWVKKEWLDQGDVWIFANAGKGLYLEDFENINGKLISITNNSKHYNRLIMAFKVHEILTYEEYFNDTRFEHKKFIDSDPIKKYGDNKIFIQETYRDANKVYISEEIELEEEIKCDKVLISNKNDFYYFGCFAPDLLGEFEQYFLKAQGSKGFNDNIALDIIEKLKERCPIPGIYGFPSFKKEKKYLDDARNYAYLKAVYEQFLDNNVKKELKKLICGSYKFINPSLENILKEVIKCQ